MIARQLETGKTHTIVLQEPLRVLLTYLTVEVDASGTVYFFPDIYGRDRI